MTVSTEYLLKEVRKLQVAVEKLHKMMNAHLCATYNRRIEPPFEYDKEEGDDR